MSEDKKPKHYILDDLRDNPDIYYCQCGFVGTNIKEVQFHVEVSSND